MTDTTQSVHSDIEAAYEKGTKVARTITVNGQELLLTHKDTVVNKELLAEFLPYPLHLKERVQLHSAESFIDYVNRFKEDSTTVFVDINTARFTAVLDYHAALEQGNLSKHGQHIAVYNCPKTNEWLNWLKHSGVKMDQEEFALFIEDNAEEIQSPNSAEMLEIASTLKADINTTFRSATRLHNGQTQFTYNENINGSAGATGQLSIPQEIEIIMTPFKGGPSYTRKARFRFRIREGKLTMWYDLVRPQRVQEEAISDTLELIKKQVDCSFYMAESPRG